MMESKVSVFVEIDENLPVINHYPYSYPQTTSAHLATYYFYIRFIISSTHARTSCVPLESSGRRFPSMRCRNIRLNP